MQKDSTYLEFSRDVWRKLRQSTPMTLAESDLLSLQGQNESLSMTEIEEIYLPLSRLLNLYVSASQQLYGISSVFLGRPSPKVPYVIGIAGSVAVGKSTVSRILKALLSRWPNHPKVEIVTTDGYLYSNSILNKKNLMEKKGFPESYELKKLIQFLIDLKSGAGQLKVPVYSHTHYDILENQFQIIDRPDIVILEGLNVLQTGAISSGLKPRFVSDFFDFSMYVDADTPVIKKWYMNRFLSFRKKAQGNPLEYFYQFSLWDEAKALDFANNIWTSINEVNLNTNILPYKMRSKLILYKKENHGVDKIFLRKI